MEVTERVRVFSPVSAKRLLQLPLLLLLLEPVLQRGHVDAPHGEVDVEGNVRPAGGDDEVEGRPEHGRWRPLPRLRRGCVHVRHRRKRRRRCVPCVRHGRLRWCDKEENNAPTAGKKIAIPSSLPRIPRRQIPNLNLRAREQGDMDGCWPVGCSGLNSWRGTGACLHPFVHLA